MIPFAHHEAAYGDGSHFHDGDTLQLDGINSDGGAFAFSTTGAVTFNQQIISSLADGGIMPINVTSLVVCTNLNADMLDGKHVGTSGNTVPLLDGTNVWSSPNQHDNIVHLTDNVNLDFGTSFDAYIEFYAAGARDFLFMGLNVGAEATTGYFIIGESGDVANRVPSGTATDPTLRVMSADETSATDFIDIYHNQVDGVIECGTGTISFGDENLKTTGNLTDGVNTLTIANAKTAYDHSQDNTQAHTDYLLNNAADTTSGRITMAGADMGGNYVDYTEMAAPSNPGANIARMYCKDDGGTTKLYFRDSAGDETELGGGAGAPGGADTQMQYNNGGAFGGIVDFTWDDTDLLIGGTAGTTKLGFRALANYINSSGVNALDIVAGATMNIGSTLTTINIANTTVTTANFGTGATTSNFGKQGNVKIGDFGTVAINDTGGDFDTWIEGNTDTELVYVDAGTDTVTIGDNLSTGKFNVAGTMFINDKLIFTQTDGNEYIDSLADGMLDLVATFAVRIRNAAAETDVVMTFVGTTNSGSIRWMEDENEWQFFNNMFLDGGKLGIGVTPVRDLHVYTDPGATNTEIVRFEVNRDASCKNALTLNSIFSRDVGIEFENQGTYKWRIFNEASANVLTIIPAGAGNAITIDQSSNVSIPIGLIIPLGTTPAPSSEGALFLDTDAGANGTLVCYSNGAFRTVQAF